MDSDKAPATFTSTLSLNSRSPDGVDPCLFISDKVICLVFVDDCRFYSPKAEYIDDMIKKLRESDMTLEVEDSVADFLGIHI
jgi:hypothetical protein